MKGGRPGADPLVDSDGSGGAAAAPDREQRLPPSTSPLAITRQSRLLVGLTAVRTRTTALGLVRTRTTALGLSPPSSVGGLPCFHRHGSAAGLARSDPAASSMVSVSTPLPSTGLPSTALGTGRPSPSTALPSTALRAGRVCDRAGGAGPSTMLGTGEPRAAPEGVAPGGRGRVTANWVREPRPAPTRFGPGRIEYGVGFECSSQMLRASAWRYWSAGSSAEEPAG